MTFENAVKKIREKFEELDATKLADMAVQVTLTDADCGGTLYFKVADGAVDVQGYDYRDNDVILDIERKALMDIISGKSTLDKAVEKGQATAKGDYGRLESIKEAVVKKAPAKKTVKKETVKKETVKKETVKKETVKKEAVKKEAVKKETPKKATAKKEAVKETAEKKETAAAPVKKAAGAKVRAEKKETAPAKKEAVKTVKK